MAGGDARRFSGAPKGLARIDRTRIADLALDALGSATDSQLVVSNDSRAAGWFPSLQVNADREPGLGPLGGLCTALRHAEGQAVIVVAWDMPFVTSELLSALRAMGEPGAVAVLPRLHADAPPEPLCAYYPAGALSACERLIAAGERRAAALAAELPGTRWLMGDALARLGDPARLLTSVDSLEILTSLGGEPPDEMALPARR
jgi:molybdopterin-guanine dinucleotide biosynthesis protein A